MAPDYVRGVINLRGAVVPVLDLSVRFGKQPSPHCPSVDVLFRSAAKAAGRNDARQKRKSPKIKPFRTHVILARKVPHGTS